MSYVRYLRRPRARYRTIVRRTARVLGVALPSAWPQTDLLDVLPSQAAAGPNDERFVWGIARNAGEFERGIHPFGERVPTLVVESTMPAKVTVAEPDAAEAFDGATQERSIRSGSLLPLALLLGIERESYFVADWLWQTVLFPLSVGSSYRGGLVEASSWIDRLVPPVVLSADEQDAFVEWAARVDERHHPSIDIAIRRALSAVRERTNVEDALIDATIAVENLFGHGGETEVGFRVTSAISILLEEDPSARAGFRSQLGKVYGSRSKIVHGGTADPTKLHEHKEQAIGVMVRCLRRLFESFPHLIPLSDRGMRLILRSDEASDSTVLRLTRSRKPCR